MTKNELFYFKKIVELRRKLRASSLNLSKAESLLKRRQLSRGAIFRSFTATFLRFICTLISHLLELNCLWCRKDILWFNQRICGDFERALQKCWTPQDRFPPPWTCLSFCKCHLCIVFWHVGIDSNLMENERLSTQFVVGRAEPSLEPRHWSLRDRIVLGATATAWSIKLSWPKMVCFSPPKKINQRTTARP